ncbi:MAG TPA: hypothetical protein VGN11_03575 [Candidatus Baltobacteraceae bacterium]|jgi:hypothetical protein|nr:hypothetical protein [Candidatus Baltobacteraceae bacterium]
MNGTHGYALRALGIGEIFDRAVTIYVRHFVVFTLMVLTLLAPYNLVQYFAIPHSDATFAQAIDQIAHPAAHTKDASLARASLGLFVAAFLVLLLLSPFVAAAVAAGVAALYSGERPRYAQSFGLVLRRWPRIFGASLVEALILVGTYVVSVMGLAILFVLAAVSIRPAFALGVLLFALAGIAALAVLALFMLLLLSYAFATYAAALESANLGEAVGGAFRRIFNRREAGKALLVALAYLALEIGVVLLSSTIGVLLVYVVKSYALQLAVNALITSALTAFLTIVLAVYYYDVRTRAEGLDLEVELQRLTAS